MLQVGLASLASSLILIHQPRFSPYSVQLEFDPESAPACASVIN
jgi:hypothetical protein